MFILILVLITLIITLPVPENLFIGILITYVGFMMLNAYPFHFKFHFPKKLNYGLGSLTVGCIGYGWRIIVYNSQGNSPGMVSFFGAFLIVISLVGWFLCLMEWFTGKEESKSDSGLVRTQGIYALIRHPQVLSSILLLIGLILYFWSIALALTAPLWIIGLVSYAALEEKLELVPRFGNDYLTYCEKTPGIIPNASSIKTFLDFYR